MVNAPIFHVNADDPEAVIHVSKIAAEWRAVFHEDVVIDLVCYRRNGHNEADEPMFTQPLMYQKIRAKPPLLNDYSNKMIKEGISTEEEIKAYKAKYDKICEDEYSKSKGETTMRFKDWLDSPWFGFFEGKEGSFKCAPTGVKEDTLTHIGTVFASPPPQSLEFVLHKGS